MIPIRDHNPTTRQPYVTVTLIVICVLVHVWQLSLAPADSDYIIRRFGFTPASLFLGDEIGISDTLYFVCTTLVTSMFLHGDLMHLAGNMLYLWIFGNNIEDVCGHGRYLVFYVLCGVAAALAQTLPDPGSTVPMIGASGAISGVLGAYLFLFPKVRVQVIIPIAFFIMRTLPAAWLLGIWIAFQVFSGVAAGTATSGVAWWAHVGGFVAGMGLIHLFRQRIRDPLEAGSISRGDVGAAQQPASLPKSPSRIPEVRRGQSPDARRKTMTDIPNPPTVIRRRDR